MLFKMWMYSTGTFLLQLAVGGGVYLVTGNVADALSGAVCATMLFSVLTTNFVAKAVAGAAMFAALTALTALTVMDTTLLAGAVITVMCAAGAVVCATLVALRDKQERFLPLFMTALPGCIGTVFGGGILLYRRYGKRLLHGAFRAFREQTGGRD